MVTSKRAGILVGAGRAPEGGELAAVEAQSRDDRDGAIFAVAPVLEIAALIMAAHRGAEASGEDQEARVGLEKIAAIIGPADGDAAPGVSSDGRSV